MQQRTLDLNKIDDLKDFTKPGIARDRLLVFWAWEVHVNVYRATGATINYDILANGIEWHKRAHRPGSTRGDLACAQGRKAVVDMFYNFFSQQAHSANADQKSWQSSILAEYDYSNVVYVN